MVNHCEGHGLFEDIEYQLQENILHHFLNYSNFYKYGKYKYFLNFLFKKSSLNREVFSIHSRLFTGSFYNISHPYKLFASQY